MGSDKKERERGRDEEREQSCRYLECTWIISSLESEREREGEVNKESREGEGIQRDRQVIYGKCKGGNEGITDLIPLITVSSGDTWGCPPNP